MASAADIETSQRAILAGVNHIMAKSDERADLNVFDCGLYMPKNKLEQMKLNPRQKGLLIAATADGEEKGGMGYILDQFWHCSVLLQDFSLKTADERERAYQSFFRLSTLGHIIYHNCQLIFYDSNGYCPTEFIDEFLDDMQSGLLRNAEIAISAMKELYPEECRKVDEEFIPHFVEGDAEIYVKCLYFSGIAGRGENIKPAIGICLYDMGETQNKKFGVVDPALWRAATLSEYPARINKSLGAQYG